MTFFRPIQNEYSEESWKKRLSQEQYEVLREGKREKRNTGRYAHSSDVGIYCCVGCDAPLFTSFAKIDDGSGYATFKVTSEDSSVKMARTYSLEEGENIQLLCAQCDCKLGFIDNIETRSADDLEQGKQERIVHVHSQAVILKKSFTITNYPITFVLFFAVALACGFSAWFWAQTFSEKPPASTIDAEVQELQ